MALALLWVPLAVHCQLESIPGLEFLKCDPCADENCRMPSSGCCEDDCTSVESGHYKVDDPSIVILPPTFLALPFAIADIAPAPSAEEPAANDYTVAPLELARIWQFSFRTALPPRAPSLAS
jgi:hypothetical protein